MSSNRKKEKHRLKRKKKQLAARKAAAITPLHRLAREGGTLECWINTGWKESGVANLMVLGDAGRGHCAFAIFLLDIWCVGVKDAWGKANVTRGEFMEKMLEPADERLGMEKITPEEARRLIAGAVRFTRQNGFRLPANWEKWAGIFGRNLDVMNADVSSFGIDGKLRYVGTESFLRKNLVGMSMEQFVQRPDVEVIISRGTPSGFSDEPFEVVDDDEDADLDDDDDDLEDEDEDEDDEAEDDVDGAGPVSLDEAFAAFAADAEASGVKVDDFSADLLKAMMATSKQIAEAVRRWCATKQIEPHDYLPEAAFMMLTATTEAASLVESGADKDKWMESFEKIIRLSPPTEQPKVRAAMSQVTGMIDEYGGINEAFEKLGLPRIGGF